MNSVDALGGPDRTRPGAPCPDAPVKGGFLLPQLGDAFVVLGIDADVQGFEESGVAVRAVQVSASDDPSGALAARYLGDTKGAVYLIRPDQHVAARMPAFDETALRAALRRACAMEV